MCLYVIIKSRTSFRVNPRFIVCLNVKKLLARSRHLIWNLSDNNGIRTHSHLVCKRTLNHLAKLAKKKAILVKRFSVGLRTKWIWVRIQLLSLKLQICYLLRARSSLTFETRTWYDNNTVKCTVQISTRNTAQSFKKMASLAKWLSVRLRTEWLWVLNMPLKIQNYLSFWFHEFHRSNTDLLIKTSVWLITLTKLFVVILFLPYIRVCYHHCIVCACAVVLSR